MGYANVYPNTMNAIPGEVTLLIDIRGKMKIFGKSCRRDENAHRNHYHKRQADYELEDLGQDQPRQFNQAIAKISEDSCKALAYQYRYMYSGAGHDAMNFAPICPTSMIFIPCKNGISHSPRVCN